MKYITDPRFVAIYKKVAFLFLTRDNGFTVFEAYAEIDNIINRLGLVELHNGHDLKYGNKAYVFRCSRIGLKKAVNRRTKISIALSLNNAFNHAAFEYENC